MRCAGGLRRPANRKALAAGRFVAQRLLWLVLILFILVVATFALVHLAPGNPWNPVSATTPEGGQAARLPPNLVARLDAKYGLDQPLPRQLLRYLGNVARFDFGVSYQGGNEGVRTILFRSWPHTLVLGTAVFIMVVPLGIGLGLWSALRHGSLADHVIMTGAIMGASVPSFVVGLLLIFPLSVGLFRVTSGRFFLPAQGFGVDEHLILPVLTLSIYPVSYLARLIRSTTLEAMQQDHVLTARAKGVREWIIVGRHIVRASLLPMITALGPLIGSLITGSVVVESLFGIPGVGGIFVGAVQLRDYPVILGSVMLFAVVLVVVNLLVDMMYAVADPRVRLQ